MSAGTATRRGRLLGAGGGKESLFFAASRPHGTGGRGERRVRCSGKPHFFPKVVFGDWPAAARLGGCAESPAPVRVNVRGRPSPFAGIPGQSPHTPASSFNSSLTTSFTLNTAAPLWAWLANRWAIPSGGLSRYLTPTSSGSLVRVSVHAPQRLCGTFRGSEGMPVGPRCKNVGGLTVHP